LIKEPVQERHEASQASQILPSMYVEKKEGHSSKQVLFEVKYFLVSLQERQFVG
jgi:hypothetical protein